MVNEMKKPYKFGSQNGAVIKEMIDLRKKGWTLEAIGQKYGVSRQAVCYHLRNHNMGVRDVKAIVRVKYLDGDK